MSGAQRLFPVERHPPVRGYALIEGLIGFYRKDGKRSVFTGKISYYQSFSKLFKELLKARLTSAIGLVQVVKLDEFTPVFKIPKTFRHSLKQCKKRAIF